MNVISIGEDITPFHSDPMQDILVIMYTEGDTYINATACGDKLTRLHKDLQEIDFPYYFVKIKTTNKNIVDELTTLTKLYSSETENIKYEIIEGIFKKQIYKGDTYCVLPWIHKYVNPQGLVMPCCLGDENYPLGSIKNNSLDDISTQPIRKQMLEGQRPNACSICWKKEDAGLESARIRTNRSWHTYKDQKHFVLRHLDIRLSNKCNLMCRMCSGKFSNRIAQEEQKVYGFTKYKDEILTPDLVKKQMDYIEENLDTIERVYFAGGEPLINEEHYQILQLLIDYKKTNIKLFYNTNFSILKFKKHNVLDLWKEFDEVGIGASIDLIGKQSNYVRHGVEYNIFEKNYNIVKEIPNITFQIASILHLMNIFNLPKLQKRWIELGLDCENINFNVVVQPEEQSINVLPDEYKTLATININDHIDYLLTVPNSTKLINQWKQAKKYMLDQNNTHLLGKFFKLNNDKDNARKQKFEDYYPEYKNLRNYV